MWELDKLIQSVLQTKTFVLGLEDIHSSSDGNSIAFPTRIKTESAEKEEMKLIFDKLTSHTLSITSDTKATIYN